MAYDAQITWWEADGAPIGGGWSMLCLDALRRQYGELQPVVLPIGSVPFNVDWIPFWESHLPEDFYATVSFNAAPIDAAVEEVRSHFQTPEVEYESVKSSERLLDVHVSFGSDCPIENRIVGFVHFLQTLHDRFPIQKLQIGSEG